MRGKNLGLGELRSGAREVLVDSAVEDRAEMIDALTSADGYAPWVPTRS